MEHFLEYHKELIELLHEFEVKYMIIGGYAVIYYGYSRTTSDMDLWIEPTNENKKKLIHVFKKLDISDSSIHYLNSLNFEETIAFNMGEEPFKVEFHTKIQGVNFETAYSLKNIYFFENLEIPVIHFNHLIESKIVSDRLKDKADVEELQKIKRHKK